MALSSTERDPTCVFIPEVQSVSVFNRAVFVYLHNFYRCSIDVNPSSGHALVGQTGGCAHLVGIDQKGKIEQVYTTKDIDTEAKGNYEFGAVFASRGQTILFGSVEGCVLVWDRNNADVIYGLDHGEGEDYSLRFLPSSSECYLSEDVVQTVGVSARV